jgi:predicted P-loop ATPase
MIVFGTSGSTRYLEDTAGSRRYWPVSVSPASVFSRCWIDGRRLWKDLIAARLADPVVGRLLLQTE